MARQPVELTDSWHPSPFVAGDHVRSGSGSYAFSPTELIQRRPKGAPHSPLEDWNERAHERHHWFQFCGTSVGAFLLTLRRAQDLVFVQFFTQDALGKRGRAALSDLVRRRVPVVRVESDGFLSNPFGPDAISQLAYIWHQLQVLWNLFLDSPLQWRCPGRRGGQLNLQLRNVISAAYHHGLIHDPADMHPFFPQLEGDDHGVDATRIGAYELSTRHILECAATLNEWWTVLGWTGGASQLPEGRLLEAWLLEQASSAVRVPGGTYGFCLNLALGAWGTSASEKPLAVLRRVTPSLLVCCDLALNPTLPPFAFEGREVAEWLDIYPPERFLRLVLAASRVGMIRTNGPHFESTREYGEKLLDAAGLPALDTNWHFRQNPRVDFRVFHELDMMSIARLRVSHYDYLVWVFRHFVELRSERSDVLAASTLITQGTRESFPLSMRAMMDPRYLWMFAPLAWTSGERLNRTGLVSEDFMQHLTLFVAESLALRQAVLRSNSFNFREIFPTDVVMALSDHLKDQIAGTTGVEEYRRWEVIA